MRKVGNDFSKVKIMGWIYNSFSAQLSDKLRQPQSSPDDIGGLWVNISYSIRASVAVVVGFERPPKRNQCLDEKCRAASAAKSDDLNVSLWSTTGRIEGKRDARRRSRKGVSVRKSRCTGVGTMLRNFIKTSSV